MAPNRKKKKPISNPSRGVATTSIISKCKVNDDAHVVPDPSKIQPVGEEASIANLETSDKIPAAQHPVKELHELTPEELELQLEESELQFLVEKYADKSKRDVSRQLSRLQTEKRLLRVQAERLNVMRWLPTEQIHLIFNVIEEQKSGSIHSPVEPAGIMSLLDDDLSIKMWTLKRLLINLGFAAVRTNDAILHIVQCEELLRRANRTSAKDSFWGLDECLQWLALVCEPKELPDYDSNQMNADRKLHRRPPPSEFSNVAFSPNDSPPTLGGIAQDSIIPLDFRLISETHKDANIAADSVDESEMESELEADELISNYVSLQGRLFKLRPELTCSDPRKIKNTKARLDVRTKDAFDPNPKVCWLLQKIEKIESDILFDKNTALEKWTTARVNLVKETAERKRLDLDSDMNSQTDTIPSKNSEKSEQVQEDDSSTLVGDFFSGLPEPTVGKETEKSKLGSAGESIEIRDYGNWAGVHPCRTLEEACKARDSSSKVSYKPILTSAFSFRHTLLIEWSRDQELPLISPIASVLCDADCRWVKVEMVSISTPNKSQSEALISTIALFLIFANSPKEEKTHLRLPQVWRELWAELWEARKEHIESTDRDELRDIRKQIADLREEVGKAEKPFANGIISHSLLGTSSSEGALASKTIDIETPEVSNLSKVWANKASAQPYLRMLKFRTTLPIWSFKDEILRSIQANQVVIVCGETGCGKSTQVPAFILENELSNGRYCKIYCTEPRRISAISLARRVSEELGERREDIGTFRSMIGYAIRLESQITAQTRIVYATTGIVMRMLERSDDLREITHLLLDEIHERTIDSDFLLLVLRKLMTHRPSLKVILMSATVNADKFSKYLDDAPIINVPGRVFPVETKYLEDAIDVTNFKGVSNRTHIVEDDEDVDVDISMEAVVMDDLKGYSTRTRNALAQFDEYRIEYELVMRLLETIAVDKEYAKYSKAILVFLPGIAEIRRLHDMLISHPKFLHGWYINSLHSTIATEDQERAFLIPPLGIRKIVLATNIAETGITIPDITCVVDTGKHKEMRFDERRQLSRLIESFISRANAKQRRGRAGRVQSGLCFHLFTRARHDRLMAEQQTPEMLRLSLQDLVLRVKICKLGVIEQTLAQALDPPLPKNVRRAIDSLIDIKALTAGEDLTALGRQLAKLPLDVCLGKLVLLGIIFQCLDATLTIAAILSSKSPFSAPMGNRAQANLARMAFTKGDSDLLTIYNAYCAWRKVCQADSSSEYQFCRKNFLNSQTLLNIEDIKMQLTTSLLEAGFLLLDAHGKIALHRARLYSRKRQFFDIPDRYNTYDNNDMVVNSVIAWSFYPKLIFRDGNGWRNVANNQAVSLHPTSVNKRVEIVKYLSFYHIMQSSTRFYNAHETSAAEDMAIALVCGEAEFKMYSGVIVIDGNRLRFSVSDWKAMLALKMLRLRLREVMHQSFRNPGQRLNAQQQVWLDILHKILSQESKI